MQMAGFYKLPLAAPVHVMTVKDSKTYYGSRLQLGRYVQAPKPLDAEHAWVQGEYWAHEGPVLVVRGSDRILPWQQSLALPSDFQFAVHAKSFFDPKLYEVFTLAGRRVLRIHELAGIEAAGGLDRYVKQTLEAAFSVRSEL